LHWSYIWGYSRWLAPRWLRKLLAGSELHRSWLSEYLGVYEKKGGGSECVTDIGSLTDVTNSHWVWKSST